MKIIQKIASPFVVFVERFYPNPFIFAIVLTLLTFLLAIFFTPTTSIAAIEHWGNGLPKLLAFMAQLALTLITAHAVAHTDIAQKGLSKLAQLPNSVFQTYFWVTLISGIASLVAWSLGLVVGALMAKQVAIEADKKGLKVHYPLLVASAYAGFVLWHMGYSSSSALFVATPGHILEEQMGILSVQQTIFSTFNIVIALVTLAVISIVCPLMHPKDSDVIALSKEALKTETDNVSDTPNESLTIGQKLDNSRIFTVLIGLLLAAFLVKWFYEQGLNLNLNIVNWTFLAAGLLLARNVRHFVRLIKNASATVGEILLQYPFYAGIMGLMAGSGLVDILSNWFVTNASADTLSFYAFLSAGIVNMFIPSGGGQWAIQGPVFIQAAQELKVNPSVIVMGIAYGDQWTNMIQPFFTIPLLAIAGLDMRKIMGFTFIILLVTLVCFGGGLLFLGNGY